MVNLAGILEQSNSFQKHLTGFLTFITWETLLVPHKTLFFSFSRTCLILRGKERGCPLYLSCNLSGFSNWKSWGCDSGNPTWQTGALTWYCRPVEPCLEKVSQTHKHTHTHIRNLFRQGLSATETNHEQIQSCRHGLSRDSAAVAVVCFHCLATRPSHRNCFKLIPQIKEQKVRQSVQ